MITNHTSTQQRNRTTNIRSTTRVHRRLQTTTSRRPIINQVRQIRTRVHNRHTKLGTDNRATLGTRKLTQSRQMMRRLLKRRLTRMLITQRFLRRMITMNRILSITRTINSSSTLRALMNLKITGSHRRQNRTNTNHRRMRVPPKTRIQSRRHTNKLITSMSLITQLSILRPQNRGTILSLSTRRLRILIPIKTNSQMHTPSRLTPRIRTSRRRLTILRTRTNISNNHRTRVNINPITRHRRNLMLKNRLLSITRQIIHLKHKYHNHNKPNINQKVKRNSGIIRITTQR